MKRLVLLLLMVALPTLNGEIKMPSLFSEGMVLQRSMPVPIWGWASPEAEVTVVFKDQTVSAIADESGKWIVRLEPLVASSESLTMTVSVGNEKHIINDVVVGEVWLCSGQSNMQRTLAGISKRTRDDGYQSVLDYNANLLKTASDPLLRQIRVQPRASALSIKGDFVGSWVSSSPSTNKVFSAVGYYFARELRRELKVPVGIITAAWGGTRIQPWLPYEQYKENETFLNYYSTEIDAAQKEQENWDPEILKQFNKQLENIEDPREQQRLRGKRPKEPLRDPQLPATLYNGMIAPLTPFALRGALWYQGESNSGYKTESYNAYLEAMIKGWRKAWGQGDFSFYIAQLANYKEKNVDPVDSDPWASVCYQQFQILSLPNTGLAVLNDLGQPKDVHPVNKLDVGKRLALWALAKDYGMDIVFSGPILQKSEFDQGRVRLTFDSVGDGLMVGTKHLMEAALEVDEPLKGFQVRGEERSWKWAKAEIVSGNEVVVWHEEILHPVEVRYAWSQNTDGNLYNKNGLPASVFVVVK